MLEHLYNKATGKKAKNDDGSFSNDYTLWLQDELIKCIPI